MKAELKDARDANEPDKVANLQSELDDVNALATKVALALHALANPLDDRHDPIDGKSLTGVTVYLDKREFMEISDAAGELIAVLGDVKDTSSSSSGTGDVMDGKYWLELQRNDPKEFKAQILNLILNLKSACFKLG